MRTECSSLISSEEDHDEVSRFWYLTHGLCADPFGVPTSETTRSTACTTRTRDQPHRNYTGSGAVHGGGAKASTHSATVEPPGSPIAAPFQWISSNPALVKVDANGALETLGNLGSAQITAEAGGVSTTVIVVIAQPVAGAKLLNDAQILSDPEPLVPDQPVLVGSQLKVRLIAIADLVPGTVLLASESRAVAGKVVSVTPKDGSLEVVFEALPLGLMFEKYSISGQIDGKMSGERRVRASARPLPSISVQADPGEFSLGSFTCKTSSAGSVIRGDLTTKLEFPFRLFYNFSEDEKSVKAVGPMNLKTSGTLTLGANVEFKTTCKQEWDYIVVPFGGAFAYLFGVQIPFGAKFEINAKLQSPQVDLGVEVKSNVQVTAGMRWTRGSGWTDSFDLTSGNGIKGKFTYPTKPPNFRIEGSLFAGAYMGLNIGSDVLQTFRLIKPLSILEANAGLKAELKLGGVQTQVDDAGYASKYELKLVLEIGLGKSTADAVKAALKN
jgi:hypothetical protein